MAFVEKGRLAFDTKEKPSAEEVAAILQRQNIKVGGTYQPQPANLKRQSGSYSAAPIPKQQRNADYHGNQQFQPPTTGKPLEGKITQIMLAPKFLRRTGKPLTFPLPAVHDLEWETVPREEGGLPRRPRNRRETTCSEVVFAHFVELRIEHREQEFMERNKKMMEVEQRIVCFNLIYVN